MFKNGILVLAISMGLYSLYWRKNQEATQRKREIASVGAIEILAVDELSFAESLEEKLSSLHSYYVLGQKNLRDFDRLLEETPMKDVYRSKAYLNLLAVRTQVDLIEHELLQTWFKLKARAGRSDQTKLKTLEEKIAAFERRSALAAMSMENLRGHMGDQVDLKEKKLRFKDVSAEEVEAELKELQGHRSFQVFETNVEHLSYMLENGELGMDKHFYPSDEASGNITGNEFPAKVWSLTFDDGPGRSTSRVILRTLQEKKLRATFFQLASQVKNYPAQAKEIRRAGMEIGAHSYSHLQLTKVGSTILDREITEATRVIEKLHGVDVEFYRLPYGAGVSVPHIRQKIAANKLVHVYWNVDSLDWMAQSPERIIKRTKGLMQKTSRDAGVILFHDIHVRTTLAAAAVMDYLKQDGRRSCTLKEIVSQMNQGASKVCP